jgi:hypothetical protein
VLAALLALVAVLWVSPAQALRIGLFVGSNVGREGEQTLQYAESDAERVSSLLVQMAGFARSDAYILKARQAQDVRQVMATIATRLQQTPGEHLFFFYYSGHADAQALHLGSSSLPFAELKQRILELPVAVRVVIVDACQSGALTRAKGGRPAPAFDVAAAGQFPRGLAILASTSDSELAQESDELRGSFFTHHLDVGLRGLADRNRDGRVTLAESFDYASEHTLHATLATSAGPQHPTFRYDLVGQQDVVLTYPRTAGAESGRVAFDRPGWYFVQKPQGGIVLELVSRGSEEVALPTGTYQVVRRGTEQLETASLTVSSATRSTVSSLSMTRLAFGRAVRKGGTKLRSSAFALSISPVVRTPLLELGFATGGDIAARVDGSVGSLELRTTLARAASSTFVPAETWEVGVALAALRAHDFKTFTLGGGVEAGWAMFHQQIATEVRVAHAPMFGPTALIEVPWSTRFCARAELGLPVYVLPVEANQDEVKVAVGLRLGIGAGGYF